MSKHRTAQTSITIPGLDPHTEYTVKVTAVGRGSRESTNAATPAAGPAKTTWGVPTVPTGFHLIEAKPDSVKLGWDSGTRNAGMFYIVRSNTDVLTQQTQMQIVKDPNATEFTDHGSADHPLVPGYTYYYWLTSANPEHMPEGGPRNVGPIRVTLAMNEGDVRPTPPSGLKLKDGAEVSGDSRTLVWDKYTGQAAHLAIRRHKDTPDFKSGVELDKELPLTATEYFDDEDLPAGTYYYRLYATNPGKDNKYLINSQNPPEVKVVLTASHYGQAPTKPVVTLGDMTKGNIQINWTESQRATGYQVFRQTGGGGFVLISGTDEAKDFLPKTDRSFVDTFTGLTDGEDIQYLVRAVDLSTPIKPTQTDSDKVKSKVVSQGAPPETPVLAEPTVQAGQVVLNWTTNGYRTTGFMVGRFSDEHGGEQDLAGTLPANTRTYTDETYPGKKSMYRVLALNKSTQNSASSDYKTVGA
jgi:hypothetical protein